MGRFRLPRLPSLRVGATLWSICDNVILLQMGSAYQTRFREFVAATAEEGLAGVRDWRQEQQEEWDRLTVTLALLATMNAAILAIAPQAPNLAFALWLGSAGLSVCGLFVVQYFPIKAFSISDLDMGDMVKDGNQYMNVALLAMAIASPVIITLWCSILFIIGIIDYIFETPMGGLQYKAIALIPISFGIVATVATLTIGEAISRRVDAQWSSSPYA